MLLARLDGGAGERTFMLEEKIGPVPCRVKSSGADSGRAAFDIPRLPAKEADLPDVAAIAAGLGLKAADMGLDGFAAARWSAGNPFTFVPVRGLDAIGRVPARSRALRQGVRRRRSRGGLHLLPRDRRGRQLVPCAHVRAGDGRARGPGDRLGGRGVRGLSGGAGGYPDGEHVVGIEQGYEMGRASQIELTLKIAGGKLTGASIAGSAVVVMEGTLEA